LFYDDTVNVGGWQEEVYDYARAVADTAGSRVIADIGCGSAWKLVQNFGDLTTLGFDLEPTLSFLRKAYPTRAWLESRLDDAFWPPQVDLVVAADVIEHIPNPDEFIRTLRRFCAQYYVISTPDRSANPGSITAITWCKEDLQKMARMSGN
jgi:2-polyprenyl-3-methyl-5-hydroxy-6-metoxy-1,4-benzoquinol methylase